MISIGDDVIVETQDEKLAVGRIRSLYNDTSQDEPCRAVVHWYFKRHELPKHVKEKICSFLSEEYELFWPADDDKNLRGYNDDIDAETIRSKCLVKLLPSSVRYRETTRKYCMRFGFTFDKKLISDGELSIRLAVIDNGIEELNTRRTHLKETRRAGQSMVLSSFLVKGSYIMIIWLLMMQLI